MSSFRFFTKMVLHIRNIWKLLKVLTPQCHPTPAESENLGVSLTVEWRLSTLYHLKQQDNNIMCFSEINTSHVQSVARVVWVEAMQASVHYEPGDQNMKESANKFLH